MFYKGQLLIATPELEGSIFDRSVVFLCDHNQEGAMGVIINKVSSISVKELKGVFPNLEHAEQNFQLGGPVSQEEVWVLHDIASAGDIRMDVGPDLFLTSNPTFLKSISEAQLGMQFIRFFLGYAGWSAGQLEAEVERGSWVLSPFAGEILKNTPVEKMWSKSLYQLGDDYSCMAFLPKDISLN